MQSITGRWVADSDFFDRQIDIAILKARITDRNHVLLSGQRKMGKTSLLRELGRQLNDEGWIVLFADIEHAKSEEDAIAEIARAAYQYRPLVPRFVSGLKEWLSESVEELDFSNIRIKLRASISGDSWRWQGESLLRDCSEAGQPVLLVIDELPMFLNRMLRTDRDASRVELFLSWLRWSIQMLDQRSLTLLISGGIGLLPLVNRPGLSDRVSYLDPFHLEPWDRNTSIACIEALSDEYEIEIENGVGEAIHDYLGLGIPHHVQSFFARLRENCAQLGRTVVKVSDIDTVYNTKMLGAPGQNDLRHYESRLNEALDKSSYLLAMEILADAALEGTFTQEAERSLIALYDELIDDVNHRMVEVLEMLVHDGYFEKQDEGYRFLCNLLNDWWAIRFRGHHIALINRNVRRFKR